MKKTLIYIFIAATIVAGNSCTKSILQKVNLNGLPGAEVWSDSTQAVLYLNGLYNLVMPVWPCNENSTSTFPSSFHNTSDESNGGTTALLQGVLTSESVTDFYASGTAGAYPYMRRINMLFANIDNYGLTPSQTAQIKAQAYFLRAYVYFDLLKLYGGIPYLTIPEDWETDNLNVPRNSTSQCIDSIVADLNHCSILPATWTGADFGRITRDAALAFKARVLLTWASPQFNPTNDQSRWQTAYTAAQNAYDTCVMDGYGLYSNFSRIALDIAVATDREPLLWRAFNGTNTSGQYEGYDGVTRPYSQSAGSGGTTNNPTWNLVQAFPMKDGYPITASSAANPYDSVYYWHNRDPRFYSTIVYNGAIYGLGSTPGRKQWMYNGITVDKGHVTTTGFYSRKNIDTTLSAVNSQYGKTFWVEMRFAEVMLTLAETANMTGNQAQAYQMLEAIRKRAGISANADGYYGLQQNMSQAQMETAILNEREVEFAFEGKRYDDLRRTRTFDQLDGTYRQQMLVSFKSPYTVSTMEKVNATTGLAPRDTINVDGPDYVKYFTHTIIPITNDPQINFLTTYYSYAIPSSNISKDPAMQQTLGWLFAGGTGTFDPTK
jgi:hypothetical protein